MSYDKLKDWLKEQIQYCDEVVQECSYDFEMGTHYDTKESCYEAVLAKIEELEEDMKRNDMIRDLETLKEFFMEQNGAYPISLQWAIDELSKCRPTGEWVPIDSRLPDNRQKVLICSVYGQVKLDTFCCEDGEVYFACWGDMDGIVAWMPLPEPYKEGEE